LRSEPSDIGTFGGRTERSEGRPVSQGGFELGRSLTDHRQPPVTAAQLERVRGVLKAYRFMAFLTGIVLVSGCIALILKYATSLHMEPGTGLLWVAHGWFYLIYVVVTAVLGFRLRWPLPRYVLVMLAGTIPTMSFVAEHFVTQAVRNAQPVPSAD
jgi:integral membrane protein